MLIEQCSVYCWILNMMFFIQFAILDLNNVSYVQVETIKLYIGNIQIVFSHKGRRITVLSKKLKGFWFYKLHLLSLSYFFSVFLCYSNSSAKHGDYLPSKLFKPGKIAFKICPTIDHHHVQHPKLLRYCSHTEMTPFRHDSSCWQEP